MSRWKEALINKVYGPVGPEQSGKIGKPTSGTTVREEITQDK